MKIFIKSIQLLLFVFGSLLTLDCLFLFALFKFNFGTVVPFLIGIIFLIHAFFWHSIQNTIENTKWLKRGWQILWFLFFAWLVSFLLFVAGLIKHINTQENIGEVTAIIILGAGVNGDRPTAALASRLDKASTIIKKQPNVVTITAGGVGFRREYSEAYIMAKYLQDEHAISFHKINQEDKSTSTEENLINSKVILNSRGVNPKVDKVAIVTNDFHTFRAKAIAKKQGYTNVMLVASQTPPSILFNAWFREYFAFISGWFLGEY